MKSSSYITILLVLLPFIMGAAQASVSEWLTPQNAARKRVGVRPLVWDTKLAAYAKGYANQRVGDCALVHSTGPYGENMFWGSGQRWTPAQAVYGWVSEKRWYNSRANSCAARDCGHFKQIVWRSTRRVGCAKVVCARGAGVLFVCEYYPPGNYVGEKPY